MLAYFGDVSGQYYDDGMRGKGINVFTIYLKCTVTC
jgi:hypothetical protein